jgi:EmrB/QacA subfamily drug resistance transporter
MASTSRPPAAAPASYSALQGRQLLIAMSGILLGLLLSSLDQTIVGTAMPQIIADLGGFEHYAWVSTAYLLTSTASVPIFGKLSDIYGRKWFYIGGLIFFMIASALCGASQTMLQLVFFRGLQGIGGGILMTNAFAIIGDLFPPAERGKWQGVTASVFGLSSIIGPALGGWLTDGPGWRWVFYVNLPVGILAVVVLIYGLPAIRPGEKRPIDWLGAASIVGTTVPLMLALSSGGNDYAWDSPLILSLFAISAVMLVVFLYAETRAVEPILPLSFFRNRTFTVSVSAMALLGAGMFGTIMFLPLFVQAVMGKSATNSGAVLTPMMLGMVVASTASGQIISRTGRYKWSPVLGLSLLTLSMFLLTRMTHDSSNAILVRNMVISGVGMGMTMPTFTLAVQNAFPQSQLGVVTSSVQFFRSIGATVGLAVMGGLLTSQLHAGIKRDVPAEVTNALPASALDSINAQALANADEQERLRAAFGEGAEAERLFNLLISSLQGALESAIVQLFVIGFAIALLALILVLFLPEHKLRKREQPRAAQSAEPGAGDPGPSTLPATSARRS